MSPLLGVSRQKNEQYLCANKICLGTSQSSWRGPLPRDSGMLYISAGRRWEDTHFHWLSQGVKALFFGLRLRYLLGDTPIVGLFCGHLSEDSPAHSALSPNKIQTSTISKHIASIFSEVDKKSFESVKLHQ